jgi:hypothetical protein
VLQLRRDIAAWVAANPNLEIADTPISDWVRWDSSVSVASYTNKMRVGGWGGGIEMAACSRLRTINVHVYVQPLASPPMRTHEIGSRHAS